MVMSDLNGDGFPDIVSTNTLDNNVSILLNTGVFPTRSSRRETATSLARASQVARDILQALSEPGSAQSLPLERTAVEQTVFGTTAGALETTLDSVSELGQSLRAGSRRATPAATLPSNSETSWLEPAAVDGIFAALD
jgi:hypothetical protein